ncbi:hypothetical protein [Paraburkholderia fungorum]|uniref:hypothetical protein n=1 Tax=Paraburkholderia fungorum TaxID=134537 RepID=UPI0038B807ED
MKVAVRVIGARTNLYSLFLAPHRFIDLNPVETSRCSTRSAQLSARHTAPLFMTNFSLSALLEFIGHDLSPVYAVIAFFLIGYVVVGLPVHFRQGAASRDIWGTAAGVTMAALYAAFIIGVYPVLHHSAALLR